MAKINRRDYLIGMGAAAGAIAGAGKLDVLGQKPKKGERRPPESKPKQKPKPKPSIGSAEAADRSEKPLIWEHQWPDPFPTVSPNEVVKLVFYGQNGFGPRMHGLTCDVGFHSRGDSAHYHRLSIEAFDQADTATRCRRVFTTDPTGSHINVERIALTVAPTDVSTRDPRFKNGVYFFQPNYTLPVLSRNDLQSPKDFRWIVDFESDYLYRKFLPGSDRVLPKNLGIYRPAFSVPYGLFHTLHRTGSTFRAQTKKGEYVSDLGSVADLIAANIYVKPNAAVTLTVNNTPYTIHAPGEIYFLNPCYKNDDYVLACETQPHNLDEKEKRSDFFLNYKAFRRGGAPEYELFIAQSLEAEDVDLGLVCLDALAQSFGSHGMHHSPLFRSKTTMIITDEAPCAGGGYGGGGGVPPFP